MDPITMIYYAVVCAALGITTPRIPGTATRLVTGAAVGLIAAAMLPWMRGVIGV